MQLECETRTLKHSHTDVAPLAPAKDVVEWGMKPETTYYATLGESWTCHTRDYVHYVYPTQCTLNDSWFVNSEAIELALFWSIFKMWIWTRKSRSLIFCAMVESTLPRRTIKLDISYFIVTFYRISTVFCYLVSISVSFLIGMVVKISTCTLSIV